MDLAVTMGYPCGEDFADFSANAPTETENAPLIFIISHFKDGVNDKANLLY